MKHESQRKMQSLKAGSMKRDTKPLAGSGRRRFANASCHAFEAHAIADAWPSQNGSGSERRASANVGGAVASGAICRNALRATSGLRTYVSYGARIHGPRWTGSGAGAEG